MANSEYNYIPTYIRRIINNRPKDVVTAKYWNELFNLLITQGDHTAEELGNILNYFSTRLVGVESEIAESAEAIANIHGTFRINVTYSDGAYSADKTFDEIKAAYDAGKLVVVRYNDALDFYYFETFGFSDSSGIHKRLNFRCDMGGIVYTLTLRDDNTWVFSETSLQPSSITDTGSYFTTDTVEGALQEIGAEMALYSGSVVIEGTASDDMSEVTITTPDAWTLVSEAWNSEKRPLVVLRLSDELCAYLTSVSTWTIDGQSQGMALFSIPPFRHLNSTQPYSIWLDESGGAAILPVESAVKSVNGKTGAVTLNASDVGAQRPLTAGSGIMLVEAEDGTTIIQSDASGNVGNGEVSFVDVAGGAPIASFTLNQTEDCEINVNDLIQTPLLNNYRTAAAQDVIDAQKQSIITDLETIRSGAAKGATALQSVPATYRTAAEQDVIDNTKLTDAPTDGKAYARKNGSWQEVVDGGVQKVNGKTGIVNIYVEDIHYVKESQSLDATIGGLKRADTQMASAISELQTADASLDSRITAIETGDTPVTLYIYWASVVGGGHVSLTKDGAAMSVADFISKMQSGAKIIIGENNDTDSESSGFTNYRYKITDSTTASLAFDVANSFNGSNRTIIISGSSSTNGLMTGYQDIGHDDLPDYSPLPEGSTPASKAWVEDYVAEAAAAIDLTSYAKKTEVPTKTSQLTNDAGYLTLATLPKYEGVVE